MSVSAPSRSRQEPSRPAEEVRVTSPAPRDAWEATLAADPHALVTYMPAWTDFVCGAAGCEDASRLYELPGGRRLVLPTLRTRHMRGALAVEASFPPSWGMGGIVAPGGLRPEDAAAVLADLAGRDVIRMSLRPNPLDGETLRAARPADAVTKPLLAHVLDLQGGFGRVWENRFSGTARTAV